MLLLYSPCDGFLKAKLLAINLQFGLPFLGKNINTELLEMNTCLIILNSFTRTSVCEWILYNVTILC